jgi:hypothetical protein
MSAAFSSRLVSSAIAWTWRLKSACIRLGSFRPLSCSSTQATPPLPDCELTRITAS